VEHLCSAAYSLGRQLEVLDAAPTAPVEQRLDLLDKLVEQLNQFCFWPR
jgi:hypothetical protein